MVLGPDTRGQSTDGKLGGLLTAIKGGHTIECNSFRHIKLGCVVKMVVDSMLLHAESGPNDHRKDALPFRVRTSV